jgi:hypothetical protein
MLTTPRTSTLPVTKAALLLVAAGLPGVLSLLLTLPDIEGVPRAALLVNPLLLLGIMAFVGSRAAPRCGFQLAATDPGRNMARMAVTGVIAGAVVALLDQLTHALWSAGTSLASMTGGWSAAGLLAGVLYGGITEEIVMRWGLMALVTLGVRKLVRPETPPALHATVVTGAVISSILFAAGHLPSLALLGEPTGPAITRTLILNLLAGLLFAGVFARHGLLVAMGCHAGFHVGVALAAAVHNLV